jgi:hypothetical protein
MPKEIHYFLFAREEVFDALVRFQATRAEKLPHDAVATIKLRADKSGLFAMIVGKSKAKPSFSVDFENADILGALVLFCRNRRIPLATRASKRLELVGDQVALLTTMNLTAKAPSAGAGTIRYEDDDVEARRQMVKEVPGVIAAAEAKARKEATGK